MPIKVKRKILAQSVQPQGATRRCAILRRHFRLHGILRQTKKRLFNMKGLQNTNGHRQLTLHGDTKGICIRLTPKSFRWIESFRNRQHASQALVIECCVRAARSGDENELSRSVRSAAGIPDASSSHPPLAVSHASPEPNVFPAIGEVVRVSHNVTEQIRLVDGHVELHRVTRMSTQDAEHYFNRGARFLSQPAIKKTEAA